MGERNSETHRWKLGDGVWADLVIEGELLDLRQVRRKAVRRLREYVDLLEDCERPDRPAAQVAVEEPAVEEPAVEEPAVVEDLGGGVGNA